MPPWTIPPGDFGSQLLFRMSYSGPEGAGSLKTTLRLASAERYQVEVVDPIGRTIWSLAVADGQGLWLDRRGHTFCRFTGKLALSGMPLGVFPPLSLPALLLGRVPAAPAGPPGGAAASPLSSTGSLPPPPAAPEPAAPDAASSRQSSYHDAEGRLWEVQTDAGGRLESWVLAENGAPSVWWLERGGWRILSDRARGAQLRWKEVLREPLRGDASSSTPSPLAVPPAGYHEVTCGGPPSHG